MNNYKVYVHIFPNGKRYVGITQQEVNRRWRGGAGYSKKQPVYNAIRKYGWDNIQHIVLYDNLNLKEATGLEVALIRALKSNEREYGYNIARGGNYNVMSDETKKKISENRKGIIFSEEHIRNLSESHKGKKPTEKQNYLNMMNNPARTPVLCVETNTTYNSIREAGRKTGINYKTINAVLKNKYGHKTAGGYHWQYAEKRS